ncbi:YSIRK-type signal peptide-containing protein [Lactobacillus crispatus]|uniref:mucin-binding protein n=1 Tax=Lactobacillus crispatus TaxID=47770 RepID=UPI001303E9D2|nr:YSIRK-type signal peptide-containing protein [Lactobacillus crispatus]QGY95778.1 YSIRK-type signal peptide-containing protein [Lactobacillus crispatus]
MLFNKHSETKQRFGIRKLTIGACSVLLSTLFLTVNNGQQVNAATGDTVTNADNNKTETDNESVTKENEATKTNNDSSVSLNKDATEVTNTSNGTDSTEKQTTETEIEDKSADATTNGSAKADATKATEDKLSDSSSDQKLTEDKSANNEKQNQQQDKTATDAKSSDTSEKSEKAVTIANNKLAKAVVKLAVTPANNKLAKAVVKLAVIPANNKLAKATVNKLAVTTDDSTPVLSQSTENGDMTLSISLPELSNKDYIPQTIKLNATNVNSGDKIVIKVKKGSAYGFAKENFPIGTVTDFDQGAYKVFQIVLNTTGKFEYKISATRNNNYLAQPSPMEDTGVTTKDIQWSINGEDQAPLSFKQTIIPELISNGVSLAKATGDKNTDFTEVAPNEDYNFVYVMGENDGLVHDGSYMANVVNSAVNYGTTITIPVPENFLLNQEASDKANKERGLTGFTMTQDGMGKDVIITVPKGQSGLAWNHRGVYYTLTGKFVYDQIPEEPTTVTAKGDSVIDQIYTSDGQRITAKGKPFSVTISGKKGRPASGPLSLSVSGAISNNQLLLDSNPNNDPVAVNWFGYSNDYDNIENAKIKLDLADGLYVTGIKTPKDLGTVYNNIGNIQSYTYEMTLTNGQKITGTVKAGDIAKSTVTTTDADNKQTIIGIRNIVFTPDTNTIGKDTKTDDIPKPGSIADQEDRIDGTKTSNVFIALGHLSHTYDNGSQVKANDKLTSSITIFGSNFRPGWNNKPIVSYTASNTQTVFDTSQYKASLSAYNDPNYTSTQPGKENAGTISLNNGDGRSNYDYIFEPIFYYVVPDNAVYSGGAISRLNSNGNESPVPVVTTYFVNGHQVVKLDYSNTNYYYNTKYGTNNGIPLDNVNNQTSNTRSWEIYAYSKDIPLLNNSYTSGKFLTPETAEKSGSTLKLDPSKFYYVGGGTWTINTASAVVLADAANGNKNPDGLYAQNGTSDDKGSDGMNFRVNVVNYDMTTDLKDLTGFINLPVKGYNNTTTNFFLSGPVDVPDGTVLYSTSSTDLPSGRGTKTPSTDNFLTEEQVKAEIASGQMSSWSDVKSIAVKYDTVKANSATKDIYIHGTDPDITTDAGKVAQISWGLYGGNGMPPLVKKNASSIVISGSSTVKTRLHYIDPKGKDQYVDVPTMSKIYKDNSDTMRDSDFNEKNIPASLIPQGYELVLQNGKAIKSIINNGGTTWATHAEDGSAQFGKLVLYNFDGDTVQFELTPKIDKATQTVNRTVHFVSDGDNPQKLANDVYETAKITELTNEVTGEKQYSATITAGGVTTDAPVVVGQDGQISISFPATTIPGVNNYYVVDSTKSEADAISPTFTFTKDGNLVIKNTVKYAPVKQELQVQVYDDDADDPSQALDTTKTGATVDFTGDSFTNFPSDVATNVDSLIKYYTDRGYLIKTKPSDEELSGKFDGDKTQTQYLKLQLVHDKATVSGEDENTPAPDTPINENDPDGVKYPSDVSKDNLVISSKNIIHYYDEAGNKILDDKVNTDDSTLTRTVTIDKVTGKVTNTSDWTGGKEYENVNTPVVNGYYVDKASASAGASTVTPADANSGRVHDGVITNETTVIYHPMGHIIPIDKSGNKIPGAETPIFTNDTKDPTKASTTNSPIIPGYHLETPSDSAITPDEPGKDRPVVYVADTQELKVQVFDLDGDTPDEPLKTDKTGATVDFTGDSFTNFPSDVATNVDSLIKYYTDRGYLIKTKPSDEELSGKFDGDKTQTQYLKLQLVHDKATVSGEDENTPAPDTPINENDPDGVKYPSDVSKDNLVISSKNIIHYYDEAGNKILDDKVNTDDSTLTRTVTIDKVTGKVTNTSDWTGGKEYENVNTPVVNGYYVDKASASAGASTVTPADANSGRVHDGVITNETTVIYHPMGHIIPIDKSGNKIPGAETPIFTNDTKDPTKASTTNSPIIPGYHLETPSDSAITPDEPGKDRPVVYVADTQELKVQVFDLDGDTPDEPLKTDKTGATVDFTGDSFTNFPSDVATNVDSLIKYYTDRGYLIKTKPSDEELSGKFDGDKTQTQYLKLQLVHDKATVSGEDENTPAPDTPINENDPDGVKYPSDVSKDNLVISSEVIIHYEGAGEKTPKNVIRTVDKTLTRTVTIDKVTGKVTNTSDWSSNTTEYESVLTPQIQGYTSDKVQVDKVSITKDNAGEAKNGKITYTFNVVYTPDKQQLILKVHDEDTQSYLGDPVIFDGYTDQEVGNSPVDKLEELKKKYLDLGYEIVEIPQLDKNYDDTPNVGGEPDKEPQVFVLKVKHRIVPVTPDDPKTPDDIIPDSNQNYPGGLTETDLSRTITRTIVVNFPSGTSQEIKQVVTYTRTATVDAVTKEVKYSAWTTKNSNWPKYVAPVVPGYTPDKDMIELTYVPADGKDVTVEINYTADPEPDEPTTPVKPGEPITPVTPTTPTTPTKPVKPTKPSKPKKPAKQTKPEVVKPVKETKGKQLYGSAQAKVDSKAAQNVVDKNKANGTNDKKLPQTNGESNWQLSLLGVGVLALALLVLKKKRDDE